MRKRSNFSTVFFHRGKYKLWETKMKISLALPIKGGALK
jgi:hypothetical protein